MVTSFASFVKIYFLFTSFQNVLNIVLCDLIPKQCINFLDVWEVSYLKSARVRKSQVSTIQQGQADSVFKVRGPGPGTISTKKK